MSYYYELYDHHFNNVMIINKTRDIFLLFIISINKYLS